MRKIIVLSMITLDGVMQGPGGAKEDESEGFEYGGWSSPYRDEDGGKVVQEELSQKTDYLLGRKTFDIWAGFWPDHADIWPGINEGTKYVLSKTKKETNWMNTVFIDSLKDIENLKDSNGPDIQVWGSSELVHLLLKNDLVDELWLKIYPLTLGKGKKLFVDTIPATFTLLKNVITQSGVIIAYYKRAGECEEGNFGT